MIPVLHSLVPLFQSRARFSGGEINSHMLGCSCDPRQSVEIIGLCHSAQSVSLGRLTDSSGNVAGVPIEAEMQSSARADAYGQKIEADTRRNDSAIDFRHLVAQLDRSCSCCRVSNHLVVAQCDGQRIGALVHVDQQ